MSFYDLFQGQCVQILMLSTIIAEHTKVCHLPGSKIACVNVHKLSSIYEKKLNLIREITHIEHQ